MFLFYEDQYIPGANHMRGSKFGGSNFNEHFPFNNTLT